jgi:murein DD-endopeptidase MepM/ murein hydrolase activator NlpD
MSKNSDKILLINFGAFTIFFVIAVVYMSFIYNSAVKQAAVEKEDLLNQLSLKELVIESYEATSENQQQQITSLKKDLLTLTSKLEIVTTFKDAGLKGKTITEIRTLLTLADNIPYGSPFKHGHRYTSMYGPRDESMFGGAPSGHHQGVDIIPLKADDFNILATANGEIIDFGYSTTMGKYIIFQTEGGYRIKYAHLNTIFWQDVENQKVKDIKIKKGTRIGIMGNTGTWTTGAHLHLEIHVFDQNKQGYVELNPWRIIEFIGGENSESYTNTLID